MSNAITELARAPSGARVGDDGHPHARRAPRANSSDLRQRQQLLVAQARVLANPTRYQLLRRIGDADGGVTISELSQSFGLTRTAIRQHVSRLVDSGLVWVQPVVPTGPGRPCHRYLATPLTAAMWKAGDPFEQVARLLVKARPSSSGEK
jgi:DNA-binding MarR family transcriptional regulator